ncbi:hypothetical protein F5H01DRAFT_417016 [Linnemannia elongata]|nr:hypothetical protein F5H01DRAFT_417016 [Linnemannia elongata]
MTSTYDASDVADSFEDLSSLSSDKDIESLVLATTYSDDDDGDLGKNSKATDNNNNNAEANGTERKEEGGGLSTKEDDDDDDGFVDLIGADVEDEEYVLSEGWESLRSTSPEPQYAHQGLSTKPEPSLPKNQASNRLHQDDDAKNSNDKKNPIARMTAKTTTNNNTNPTSGLSIPRRKVRMAKDNFAALSKSIPSASVAINSSPPSDCVVISPSRLRLVHRKAVSNTTSATATATTPDDANVRLFRSKKNMEPKKAVRIKLPVASTVDQPTAPTATFEHSVSSATGAAVTTTEKT